MFKKHVQKCLAKSISLTLLAAAGAGCSAAADEVIEEVREVESFQWVNASISGRIELVRGSEAELLIEAVPDTLERIFTEVDDGILRIYQKDGGGWWRDSGPIRIHITYEALDGLDMSGSADVTTDELEARDFAVKISGSSNIEIPEMSVDSLEVRVSGSGDLDVRELAAEAVDLRVSGSGDVVLSGATESLTVAVNGSGNVESDRLEAQRAEVTVSGSGDVEVRVTDELEVSISGSGNVDYWGDPEVTSRISGSGDLDKR